MQYRFHRPTIEAERERSLEAAASLGVGVDYDVGFPPFGSVPADETETGRAAAMIGQAKVEASPLAMASVRGVGGGRQVGVASSGLRSGGQV